MLEKTLYIKDNADHLRYWTCREALSGLEMEYGVVGGTAQFQYEDIDDGKAGRDQDEQIESRFNSRINKQLDKGYVENIDIARTMKPVNRLGFSKPMLAKKQEDVDINKMKTKPFFLQYKLDGNRCLVHEGVDKLTAYTRNGKEFLTLEHITKHLEGVLPTGVTLDGELYIHGVPLQTIVSLVKRKQVRTEDVEYHVYDIISDEPFSIRYNRLGAILSDVVSKPNVPIKLVKATAYAPNSPIDLGVLLKAARDRNYEGLMFRSDFKLVRGQFQAAGYEDGKRSGSLIKFKDWESDEFEVVNIIPSKDDWARLVCSNPRGENFTVSCPGEMAFKRYVLDCKHMFKGKKVTVQFAYWTKAGTPFHPTAVAFRDYE